MDTTTTPSPGTLTTWVVLREDSNQAETVCEGVYATFEIARRNLDNVAERIAARSGRKVWRHDDAQFLRVSHDEDGDDEYSHDLWVQKVEPVADSLTAIQAIAQEQEIVKAKIVKHVKEHWPTATSVRLERREDDNTAWLVPLDVREGETVLPDLDDETDENPWVELDQLASDLWAVGDFEGVSWIQFGVNS